MKDKLSMKVNSKKPKQTPFSYTNEDPAKGGIYGYMIMKVRR